MAEKLCTLRTKGGGGGKYTETSLWTNSAPTSDFPQTTVTLSDSMSNYKYLAFAFKGVKSSTTVVRAVVSVEDLGNMNITANTPDIRLSGGDGTYIYSRYVIKDSDTTITFGGAHGTRTQALDNSRAIPLEILGLNELDHGTKYTTNASEIAFKSVSANTIPTFTTVAEAKAIWLTINYASAYRALQITNVNPTTGEINNESLYKIDTSSMGNIEPLTFNKFIVTSNSVTMQNAPSTAATQQSLIYTY